MTGSCLYGALWTKFQPDVLNPFVFICGCLLYYYCKKRMDQLKHQDIIIGEMGINQTDSNLHKHLFRTNLFVALWGQKFAYKILKLSKPRQRRKLSYSHDALQTIIGESSLKKMRFRGQRIHWFHLNENSIHVKKKTITKINMRIQIHSGLCL